MIRLSLLPRIVSCITSSTKSVRLNFYMHDPHLLPIKVPHLNNNTLHILRVILIVVDGTFHSINFDSHRMVVILTHSTLSVNSCESPVSVSSFTTHKQNCLRSTKLHTKSDVMIAIVQIVIFCGCVWFGYSSHSA